MYRELPEQKGKRLYNFNKVTCDEISNYCIEFTVKDDRNKSSQVIFILNNLEFKCMNKYCSNFRAGKTYPTCWHTFAVQSWLLNNKNKWRKGAERPGL